MSEQLWLTPVVLVANRGLSNFLHFTYMSWRHRQFTQNAYEATSSLPVDAQVLEHDVDILESTDRKARGMLGALGLLVAGGAALGAVMAGEIGNFDARNDLWAVAIGTAMGAVNDVRFSLNLRMPIFRRNTLTA